MPRQRRIFEKPPSRCGIVRNAAVEASFRRHRFGNPRHMIDNPHQVERLVTKMRESLPLFAALSHEVAAGIREQSPATDSPRRYPITRVDYAGDEGGIVCKVELGPENGDRALFASITHLQFGRAGSIGRQIAAYQKTSGQTLAACGLRNPGLTGVRAMTRRAKSKGSAALATGSDAW